MTLCATKQADQTTTKKFLTIMYFPLFWARRVNKQLLPILLIQYQICLGTLNKIYESHERVLFILQIQDILTKISINIIFLRMTCHKITSAGNSREITRESLWRCSHLAFVTLCLKPYITKSKNQFFFLLK